MTEVFIAGAYFDRPGLVYRLRGRLDPSHGQIDLRAHLGRILIVFGAPIAFCLPW
jgi:hypothetical protein